jgi:two-component sensor histidine kinase
MRPTTYRMENILHWLPSKPQPVLVRYGISSALVGVCFVLMRAVEINTGVSCFFIMYPAVFLAAALFDRGSGVLAVIFSTALLVVTTHERAEGLLPQHYWLPLTLFFLIGLLLAVLAEALRKGWERAAEAERTKDLLYRELGHRTKNDFAMAGSVLMLQARSQSNSEVTEALHAAVGRLNALARAHQQFEHSEDDSGGVQMRSYLEVLCQTLGEAMARPEEVVLNIDCEEITLPIARAIPVGLITNELVTNAYKHAFDDGRQGLVTVALKRGASLSLLVEDNGKGCAEGAARGLGSQLVQLLVRQLEGSMERKEANPGCRVHVTFPERVSS